MYQRIIGTLSKVCYAIFNLIQGGDFMKRNAISDLAKWKNSPSRKPLVIRGARQVGKTWLMREFGQNYYDSFVYLNFAEEDELKSIFETNKNPHRILELLSLIMEEKILPGKTLIMFAPQPVLL